MAELGLTAAVLVGLFLPGIYIGLQAAIAWSVFKALTKKR